MKKIVIALKELRNSIVQIKIIEALLDTILVFFVSYLVLAILEQNLKYALLPTIIFGFMQLHRKVNEIGLKDVEEYFPHLKEQLRTAADNAYKENEIINSLHEDVLTVMKNIRTSVFVPFKKMWREIITIAVLSFIIIMLAAFNVRLVDVNAVVDTLKEITNPDSTTDMANLPYTPLGGEDIFGNASVATLGNKEIELEINPVLSEINLDDIQDVKEREFEQSPFPDDIRARADKSFDTQTVIKENQEIVKKYFSEISKIK